jgi:hypothetical protein
MKKIYLIFTFLFLIAIFLLNSCIKPCIESRLSIEGAGLVVNFFNTGNNEYFYPENTSLSPYKIDSLRVKDSKENLLRTDYQLNLDPRNPLTKFNVVDIYPIFITTDDQAAYDREQTKFIYIKYNYNTFDTLKLVFKARKEKCGNNFEYLKIYYKNILLLENHNNLGPFVFTLNH